MIVRPFWANKIEALWKKRPLVWLSGVRRVGKTTLAKMTGEVIFINCDLPSEARRLADPELFFEGLEPGSRVVFDEIHRLEDPSRILKIAADAYPTLKVLATGSSTLAATRKFRDSLTGRKHSVYLSPVLWGECREAFGPPDLDRRLLHGGLPEALLAKEKDPEFFNEWIDSFYARDIQELFAIRIRSGFLKLLRLLLRQSGGLVDYTQLAKLSGLSRPTVMAHVEALTVAHAVFLLPPFHGSGRREITRRPKAYAFDTGFITHVRGWTSLRSEDRGVLWEHLVLDALRSSLPMDALRYWRDKSGREVDFVVARGMQGADFIECKLDPEQFDPGALKIFRSLYPAGENYLVSPVVKEVYSRSLGDHVIRCCDLVHLPYGSGKAAGL
jgi:uncharacterized protein